MHTKQKHTKSTISINKSYEGESIEAKLRRIVNNKEPITDRAEMLYTDRKEGVKPETDIRTDRFEIAIDGMDKVARSHKAKREERHKSAEQREAEKVAAEALKNMKKEGEAQPIRATSKILENQLINQWYARIHNYELQ